MSFAKKILKEAIDIDSVEQHYPRAGNVVDGRTVLSGVPNFSSIAASFEDYEILSGIREVQMSEFHALKDSSGPFENAYRPSEKERTEKLAAEIQASDEISPLIVVIDNSMESEGPYILEGGHRFDALWLLKAKSFPAKIVVDFD